MKTLKTTQDLSDIISDYYSNDRVAFYYKNEPITISAVYEAHINTKEHEIALIMYHIGSSYIILDCEVFDPMYIEDNYPNAKYDKCSELDKYKLIAELHFQIDSSYQWTDDYESEYYDLFEGVKNEN